MTSHPASRIAAFAGLALALAAGPATAQDGPWVLTNARIFTVTRGVIERGTIVIRDGLIAAVGPDVAVPADARVLDLAGKPRSGERAGADGCGARRRPRRGPTAGGRGLRAHERRTGTGPRRRR
jgi:hypothetical protein